jgi:hypothetical protein
MKLTQVLFAFIALFLTSGVIAAPTPESVEVSARQYVDYEAPPCIDIRKSILGIYPQKVD